MRSHPGALGAVPFLPGGAAGEKNRADGVMTAERQRLPNRRQSETFGFEHAGLKYTATASWFADGRLGEVFVSNGKADSQADANARDAAIVASIALQHGAPLDVVRGALLRDGRGRPSTPIGAALDLLATNNAAESP